MLKMWTGRFLQTVPHHARDRDPGKNTSPNPSEGDGQGSGQPVPLDGERLLGTASILWRESRVFQGRDLTLSTIFS